MRQSARRPAPAATLRSGATLPWSLAAALIAALVLAPVLAVGWIALHPTENIWPHLLATALPRYVGNTVLLALGTGALIGWLSDSIRLSFSTLSILVAFFSSTLIGITFGFLPARAAARLDPVVALSRE